MFVVMQRPCLSSSVGFILQYCSLVSAVLFYSLLALDVDVELLMFAVLQHWK